MISELEDRSVKNIQPDILGGKKTETVKLLNIYITVVPKGKNQIETVFKEHQLKKFPKL